MVEKVNDNGFGDEDDMRPVRDIRPAAKASTETKGLDENVAAHFPRGAKLQSIWTHGGSKWTETYRIDLLLPNDQPDPLFLKVAHGQLGLSMVRGEYEAVYSIAKFAPHFVPEPKAWGTYASDPNTHFYLASFVDMVDELPNRSQFCETLAKLHKDSRGHCPQGNMFGFPVSTSCGWLIQNMTWTESWEGYFARTMQEWFIEEEKVNGEWEEMEELKRIYFEKVIPRLLRPLQSGGRHIDPVLLHNDVWVGNMGRRKPSGDPVVYDPGSLWGHHEYELRGFLTPIFKIGPGWVDEYLKHFPASEPQEDFWDRYYLYSRLDNFLGDQAIFLQYADLVKSKGYITTLVLHPDPDNPCIRGRQEAVEKFRYLVDKYKHAEIPPGSN